MDKKQNLQRIFLLLFFFWLVASVSLAHDMEMSKVTVTLDSSNHYQMEVKFDLFQFMKSDFQIEKLTKEEAQRLSQLSFKELQQYLKQARQRFQNELQIHADGKRLPIPEFSFVQGKLLQKYLIQFLRYDDHDTPRLQIRGELPEGVEELDFVFPKDLGKVGLQVIYSQNQMLGEGEKSLPLLLFTSTARSSSLFSFSFQTMVQYLKLGFTHIIPLGLDHILFVLGLFFFTTKFSSLLGQVTAFTIAHSLTLALSMFGLFSLPSSLVEPLIAFSIVLIALENLLPKKIFPKLAHWKVLVVFCFGLLHGLGFAGVLQELGLPQEEYLNALFSFNVGIELAQLSLIGVAFVTVGWFRKRTWYQFRIALPLSFSISLIGGYWMLERIFFL